MANFMQAGPWQDSGFSSPAEYAAHLAAQEAAKPDQNALLQQYQTAGGKLTPQQEMGIAGGNMPEFFTLPTGAPVLRNIHPDAGVQSSQVADGRLYRESLSAPTGHWDNPQQTNVGYTLHDRDHKSAADWGLNLTPAQQQALGNKDLTRYEKFDTTGKSQGYGYELYDDRGFLQSVIQDLGPVLMAPLMSWASPALAGGIGSLTGFSPAVSQALSGSLLGGTTSALGGGDFLKGAVLGGVGGAINAFNPAEQLGVTGAFQKPLNNALSNVARGVLSGQDIEDVLKRVGTNPALLLSLLDKADGKAAGGLIADDTPDTVTDARLLTGIASNLHKG